MTFLHKYVPHQKIQGMKLKTYAYCKASVLNKNFLGVRQRTFSEHVIIKTAQRRDLRECGGRGAHKIDTLRLLSILLHTDCGKKIASVHTQRNITYTHIRV